MRESEADRTTPLLDACQAERAAAEISKNGSRAVSTNAVTGRPHGRHLYGLARTYDPRTGALVSVGPREDQAAVVREIFVRFTSGVNTNRIARDLNARGIPPTDRTRVRCPACGKLATWHHDGGSEPGKVTVGRHHGHETGQYCEGGRSPLRRRRLTGIRPW